LECCVKENKTVGRSGQREDKRWEEEETRRESEGGNPTKNSKEKEGRRKQTTKEIENKNMEERSEFVPK
jgi:hypothetical protein